MKGQNDGKVDEFIVSDEEFQSFLNAHKTLNSLVSEVNNQMIAS